MRSYRKTICEKHTHIDGLVDSARGLISQLCETLDEIESEVDAAREDGQCMEAGLELKRSTIKRLEGEVNDLYTQANKYEGS